MKALKMINVTARNSTKRSKESITLPSMDYIFCTHNIITTIQMETKLPKRRFIDRENMDVATFITFQDYNDFPSEDEDGDILDLT